jgi:hypothetical protein
MDGREEDPTQIVHFSLGPASPGGGITKVKPEDFLRTEGKGGPVIHLFVDDLEVSMKVRTGCRARAYLLISVAESGSSWRQEDDRGRARRYEGAYAVL